ncbi:MAG: hypothetical protein WCD79_09610 [Chthoniobacteraceae bacterium]
MNAKRQKIQDPETEAEELQKALVAVGDAIRKSNAQRGKSGLNYKEFKAQWLKKHAKVEMPSHA